MISIYYTLCYSRLIYCVSIWACTWPSFLSRLQIAQNKVFRCIYSLKKFDSVTEIVNQEKFLKFSFIHKFFTLLLIFKTLGQFKLFRLVDNVAHTRSSNVNLVCPGFRTTLFKYSIFSFGPNLFNSLPLHIKTIPTTNKVKFKQEIKKYLLQQQCMIC